MAFPSKKPNIGIMLGISPKGPREEPPPAYSGMKKPPMADPAADPMQGQEGEGMCSVTCPKCGEQIQLQITPDAGGMDGGDPSDQGAAPDMGDAG